VIEVRQVQEFTDFPADVQKAAAGFPEMQAQSKQSKGRSLWLGKNNVLAVSISRSAVRRAL